jgi:hypothetical protein
MQFISLEHAFKQDYIKSLPHLTWLDLTANEKLLIELVFSYRRSGLDFYMNYVDIADRLVLNDTKSKAKSVGNIIAKLRKKGYIETMTTHNYNGKNGGSSTTITVNETFLEAQLHAAFNAVEVLDQNTPQALPVLALEPILIQRSNMTSSGSADAEFLPSDSQTRKQTADEFIAELDAMDDEPLATLDLPCLGQLADNNGTDEDHQEDYRYMELKTMESFKLLLQGLMGFQDMYPKRSMLQSMIDNEQGWDLDKMKRAFASTILTQ